MSAGFFESSSTYQEYQEKIRYLERGVRECQESLNTIRAGLRQHETGQLCLEPEIVERLRALLASSLALEARYTQKLAAYREAIQQLLHLNGMAYQR